MNWRPPDSSRASVSQSPGEKEGALGAAVDANALSPSLGPALGAQVDTCGEAAFADQLTSAMRLAFGGRAETPTASPDSASPDRSALGPKRPKTEKPTEVPG